VALGKGVVDGAGWRLTSRPGDCGSQLGWEGPGRARAIARSGGDGDKGIGEHGERLTWRCVPRMRRNGGDASAGDPGVGASSPLGPRTGCRTSRPVAQTVSLQ